MSDDELQEYDLFGEGDVVENFRKAIGEEGVKDDPPDPLPTVEDVPLKADLHLANSLLYIAGCTMALTLPFPPPLTSKLQGLWITLSGYKMRFKVTTGRRMVVDTMGMYSVPLMGARVGEGKLKPGDRVRHKGKGYEVKKCIKKEVLVGERWVPERDVILEDIRVGDAVVVKRSVASEVWERAVVETVAPVVKCRAEHSKAVKEYGVVEADPRVSFMGCRLLPTSSLMRLEWDDGDVWRRVQKNVHICLTCGKKLAFKTSLPPPYTTRYWCSVCGTSHSIKRGVFHCKRCQFDVCKPCAPRTAADYPPLPTTTHIKCSACNAKPFTMDTLCSHWLNTCPKNPFRPGPCRAKLNSALRFAPLGDAGDEEEVPVIEHKSLTNACYLGAEEYQLDDLAGNLARRYNGDFEGAAAEKVFKQVLINTKGWVMVKGVRCGLQVVKEEDQVTAVVSGRGEAVEPLFYAIAAMRVDVIKWLLLNGCDACVKLKNNTSCVKLADSLGYCTVANLLRNAFLSVSPIKVRVSDPLHVAALHAHPAVPPTLPPAATLTITTFSEHPSSHIPPTASTTHTLPNLLSALSSALEGSSENPSLTRRLAGLLHSELRQAKTLRLLELDVV